MEIILASASPRRAELLQQIGIKYRVEPSCITEGQPFSPWPEWVQRLAQQKALAVPAEKGDVVLGADTIVVHSGEVLGKPKDKQEAQVMLRKLSGSNHQVMTGVCVAHYQEETPQVKTAVEITQVTFRHLTEKEIINYVASGESLDKAGAYGIQGLGALLVERIQGCYFNVVGLPLVKIMQLLRSCGVPILGEDYHEKADSNSQRLSD
ncbi:MAG: Maf family protein [Peptococcia bacterium]